MSRAIIPNLRGLNNHSILLMILWIRSQDVLVWAVLACSHSCGYNRVSDRASAVFRVPLARASMVGHSHGSIWCWLLASSSTGLLTRVPPHSPCSMAISGARLPVEHLTFPEATAQEDKVDLHGLSGHTASPPCYSGGKHHSLLQVKGERGRPHL